MALEDQTGKFGDTRVFRKHRASTGRLSYVKPTEIVEDAGLSHPFDVSLIYGVGEAISPAAKSTTIPPQRVDPPLLHFESNLCVEIMDSPHEEVRKALSLVHSNDLPHPLDSLISSFVTEAVDPRAAANFVIHALPHRRASSLVSDWRFIVEARE